MEKKLVKLTIIYILPFQYPYQTLSWLNSWSYNHFAMSKSNRDYTDNTWHPRLKLCLDSEIIWPFFSAFGLNMKILSVNLRFSPNVEKCRPQKLRIWTLLGSDHVMISVEKMRLYSSLKYLQIWTFLIANFFSKLDSYLSARLVF